MSWVLEQKRVGGLTGLVWLTVSRHGTEMQARRAMATAIRNEPFLSQHFRVRLECVVARA